MIAYLGTSNINNIAPWVHGAHTAILAKRRELYKKAQKSNSNRWSKGTINWDEIGDLELNS